MNAPDPKSAGGGFGPIFAFGENTSPVSKLLNLIVYDAMKDRCEQVHLAAGGAPVLFFRDGSWFEYMKLPSVATQRLINRVRVLASLDRIKGNARQEGAMDATINGAKVDIRAIVQFTSDGHEEAFLSLSHV